MLNKRIKTMELIEILLILSSIILLVGVLFITRNKLITNATIYNILVLSIIMITAVVISIVIFQFVKRKYIEDLKEEIEENFDVSRKKLEEKVLNTNNRIFGFEANYSKKLKKVMKDYNIKVKEIENIKKELSMKLNKEDRKIASLEFEICRMKLENIFSEDVCDNKDKEAISNRIVMLNEKHPGLIDNGYLDRIRSLKNNSSMLEF